MSTISSNVTIMTSI